MSPSAPSNSDRYEIFNKNAQHISSSLPGLARGMLEIPQTHIDSLALVELPPLVDDLVDRFTSSASEKTQGDGLVVLGLSNPELLSRLRNQLPEDRALIVVEPTLELALSLLSQNDYSDVFEKPYTAVVFGAEDRALQEELRILIANWGLREFQLIINPMRPLGDEIAGLVADVLRETISGVELSASTGAKYSRQILASIAANLEAAVSAFDISGLEGRLSNLPAFCVAAGPSLDKDIELLSQAKERGIIIAADAAVPPLMAAGITPDIVTTIDVIDTKSVVFEKNYVKDALLVALLGTHSSIVDAWIGPRAFAIDNHPVATRLASHLVPPSRFGSLGNVAHLSFALARGLGCDPVVLVGTDLAVARGGRTYAHGVIHHDEEGQVLSESDAETKTTEIIANDGNATRTFENMVNYIHTFSSLALTEGQSLNTAYEGARIPGIPYCPLSELIDNLEVRDISRPLVGDAPSRDDVKEHRAEMLEEITSFVGELRDYVRSARSFVAEADALRDKVEEEGISDEEAVKHLKPYLEDLSKHTGVVEIVELLQPAIAFELNRLTRKTLTMADVVERARTRIATIAGASAGGAPLAEYLADQLVAAAQKLSQPMAGGKKDEDE